MADTKSIVQDLIFSLKQGSKGRLGRSYRINFVVYFLFVSSNPVAIYFGYSS